MIRTAIEESAAPALTFADVLARVRRRPVVFALPIVLGLAASLAYVFLAPKTYVAKASIQVLPVVSDQYGSINLANVLNMATEQQIAQSSGVVDRAATVLGTTDADIQDSVSVDSPQDTQVLNVRYAAGSAAMAARGAQVVAQAYLDNREADTKSDAGKRVQGIDKRISDARSTLKGGLLNSELQSLYSQRRQFETIMDTPVGRIITNPAVPTAPASPRLGVDVPLGLAAGLIAGLVLAVLLPVRERKGVGASSRVTAARRARGTGKPSEFDRMLAARAGRLAPPSAAPVPVPLVVPDPPRASAPTTSPAPERVNGAEAPAAAAVSTPAPGPAFEPAPPPLPFRPALPASAPAPAPVPAAPAPAPAPVAAPAPAPAAPVPAAPAPTAPAATHAGTTPSPAPGVAFPVPAVPASLFEPVRPSGPAPNAPAGEDIGANGAKAADGEHPAEGTTAADGRTSAAPADGPTAGVPEETPTGASRAEARPAPVPR